MYSGGNTKRGRYHCSVTPTRSPRTSGSTLVVSQFASSTARDPSSGSGETAKRKLFNYSPNASAGQRKGVVVPDASFRIGSLRPADHDGMEIRSPQKRSG